MDIIKIVVIVAVLIIAWAMVDRFSPDPLLTLIAKVVIFVVALYVLLKMILPLAGVNL